MYFSWIENFDSYVRSQEKASKERFKEEIVMDIKIRQNDIHDENKPILFRHFVEYFVRAVYLRNGLENEL